MNEPTILMVGNVGGVHTQGRSVYLTDSLSPTLTAGMTHGNTVPYIVEITEISNGRYTDNRADGRPDR